MAFATTGERKHGLKYSTGRLPGGLAVKNPPCNAGNSGSIPVQGTQIPHAVEQLSHVPQLESPSDQLPSSLTTTEKL